MKQVELGADYAVAAARVVLSIKIGDAQIGSSIVKVGNKEKRRGAINMLFVGHGASLVGKTLRIKSIVIHVNDRTNHTSITYILEGGRAKRSFVSSGTVEQDGDSICYVAKFKLKR